MNLTISQRISTLEADNRRLHDEIKILHNIVKQNNLEIRDLRRNGLVNPLKKLKKL